MINRAPAFASFDNFATRQLLWALLLWGGLLVVPAIAPGSWSDLAQTVARHYDNPKYIPMAEASRSHNLNAYGPRPDFWAMGRPTKDRHCLQYGRHAPDAPGLYVLRAMRRGGIRYTAAVIAVRLISAMKLASAI